MESDFGTHDTTKRRVSEPEFLCPDGSRPMYVPPAFRLDDRAAAIEVMRVHPFAMLAAATGPGAVEITHLPILVDRDGEVVTLRGHVARANPMARLIADSTPQAPLHATAEIGRAHVCTPVT